MGKEKIEFYPKILSAVLDAGKKEWRGDLYFLFCDISGFTQISESLMSSGFEGAERIRDILSAHFSFFSKTIYSKGGDILQYSGDAILSVFRTFSSAEDSMREIINFTKESGVLSIRGGIAFGESSFRSFEFNGGYILLSTGEGIERAMSAEQKSDIMSYIADTDERREASFPESSAAREIPLDRSISKVFETCNLEYGSFAFASILFLFAEERDIEFILKAAEGRIYLNKIEKYPEGIRFFFLSGVLDSSDNPVEKMLEFLAEMESSSIQGRISGGLTSGYIFNGFTGSEERCEYNLIGKSINRAARIASKANAGEILFDKEILSETASVSGEFIRSESLKGIGIVNLYRMKEYRKHSVPLYLPLYGRGQEMERLEKILSERRIAKLSGESGAGKTHFVSSFIYEKNLNAVYLNVSSTDTLKEYSVFEMLGMEAEEGTSKNAAYRKFLDFMLGRHEKEILVIDNYDKLDEKSSEIIDRFLEESVSSRAILISSSLKGDINLTPFDSKGISGLIEIRTGIAPSAFLAETLYRKTVGNPYFVLAFFKSLVSENLIEMNYLGEWDLNSDKKVVSSDISSSVQIIFSSLSPLERNILKVSSVFDFGCSEDSLIKILRESDFEIVSKTIMELVQKNLLQKKEREISFVNDVVRDHIYRSILVKERSALHLLAARTLLSSRDFLEAGRHFLLGGNSDEAGRRLAGYSNLIEEGKNSLALYYARMLFETKKSKAALSDIVSLLLKEGRYQEAESLFRKEKGILDSDTEIILSLRLLVFRGEKEKLTDFAQKNIAIASGDEAKFTILDETAFAMSITGDETGESFADKAYEMFKEGRTGALKKIKLGGTYRQLGDYDRSEAVYRTLHERFIQRGERIDAYAALSEMLEMLPAGRFPADYVIEVNETLLSLLDRKDRKREELKALKMLTMRLRDMGEYEKAHQYGERAIGLARILKDSITEAIILTQLARMEFNAGNNEKSMELFEKARILAQKNNSVLLMESICGNMGVLMHVEKEYSAAYELYERALDISLKVKHSDTRFLWILNLALLGVETRQMESAESYIKMAKEEIERSNIPERWIDIEQIAANCAFLQKDYRRCRESSLKVLDEAKRRGETEIYYETLPYYAGALILEGDGSGERLLSEAIAWAEEKNSENVRNNIEDVRRALNPPEQS